MCIFNNINTNLGDKFLAELMLKGVKEYIFSFDPHKIQKNL